MSTAMRFAPGGKVMAIHDDGFPFEKAFGVDFAKARRRASIINTVEEGRYAGYFYADMSYLADRLGDDTHRVCLYPPRKEEADCKADEFIYVRDYFIERELT